MLVLVVTMFVLAVAAATLAPRCAGGDGGSRLAAGSTARLMRRIARTFER